MAAYTTQAVTGKTVMGNKRVHYGTFTANAAEGHITTGLAYVDSVDVRNNNTTAAVHVILNASDSDSTASNGNVYCSATADKTYYWKAEGR